MFKLLYDLSLAIYCYPVLNGQESMGYRLNRCGFEYKEELIFCLSLCLVDHPCNGEDHNEWNNRGCKAQAYQIQGSDKDRKGGEGIY